MATRFYMPSSGTAGASPSPSASWGATAGTSRVPTSTTKSNTAFDSSGTYTETSTTNGINVLGRQFVSAPLAAQTISGTFSLVVACLESSTNANASLQAIVRVVSNDGSTVRGTLYAGHSAANTTTAGALGQEMATSGTTRIMNAVALSLVTLQEGDRIVVEVGGRFANTTATAMAQTFQWGDPSSASDYALTAGNTSLAPAAWFEFSQNLVFQSGSQTDQPDLIDEYVVAINAANNNALVTPSFTPSDKELLIVKATNAFSDQTFNNLPVGGSLTFVPIDSSAVANYSGVKVWAAKIETSPGAMTVSLTPTGTAQYHSMIVERWSNAKVAATPATNATKTGASGTAPSATVTTVADNSRVSWVCGDWNAISPATRGYRSGAAETGLVDQSPSNYVAYFAYQDAPTAGTQTIGLTSPNQKWAMIGVEIQYDPPFAKIETLTDDFATQDTAKWNFTSAAATVTGGRLAISTGSDDNAGTVTQYDLTSSAVFVELDPGNGGYVYFELDATSDSSDNLNFLLQSGLLYLQRVVGGSTTVLATPTYDPVAHRWLRFSESGGTVTWSTSPDGSTWTSRGTWTPSFAVTAMWAFLGSGGGGTSYFDNVNVVPTGDNTKFFLAAA